MVVPGGAVIGTLTAPVPVFLTVTTPFCSVAVTLPAVWAADHAVWSASTWPTPPRVSC